MLERMLGQGHTPPLLMGLPSCTVILEISYNKYQEGNRGHVIGSPRSGNSPERKLWKVRLSSTTFKEVRIL